MDADSTFHPSQIVCLEHGNAYLYAEVIQVIPARQLCWARPLALALPLAEPNSDASTNDFAAVTLYDLRQGADLLWPISLFRTALDTEVIPLLTQIGDSKQSEGDRLAHHQLRAFMRLVWQSHPDAFQSL